jgi:hypothetical protein
LEFVLRYLHELTTQIYYDGLKYKTIHIKNIFNVNISELRFSLLFEQDVPHDAVCRKDAYVIKVRIFQTVHTESRELIWVRLVVIFV